MKHQIKKILTTATFILVVISVFAVQAQTPQEMLNQYISDLQKNPPRQ